MDPASEILKLERLLFWMDSPEFASVYDIAKTLVRQRSPLDTRPIEDVYLPGDSP